MLDSWIDEVYDSARWLYSLLLFHLLSLGSGDRSHDEAIGNLTLARKHRP